MGKKNLTESQKNLRKVVAMECGMSRAEIKAELHNIINTTIQHRLREMNIDEIIESKLQEALGTKEEMKANINKQINSRVGSFVTQALRKRLPDSVTLEINLRNQRGQQ